MMVFMAWKRVDPKKIHRLFYPQVPVVVTVEWSGRLGALPAIWCVPLSFTPPLVGAAVAPDHETCKMILKTRDFGINWLEFAYADRVGRLGEISGKGRANKLSVVGLTAIRGSKTGQPLIKEASAAIECQLKERHRFGTHDLLVGKVAAGYAVEAFKDYWNFSKYEPLLYAGTTSERKKSWIFMSRCEAIKRVQWKQ
jgi:flavin reductase (DIM6/NTAB) family NADH-FMN oxidoreductase RutF